MRWLLAFIGVALVWYWWSHRPPITEPTQQAAAWEQTGNSTPKPSEPSRPPPVRTPTNPKIKTSITTSPRVQTVPPPASDSKMSYSKQGLVHFRMIDGLAVSFGDIILGKPTGDEKIESGFFKPPTPQPWKGDEIAYAISPDLARPDRVEQAIEYFRRYTPVNFVPYSGQKDALVFESGQEHCLSYVGRVGGHQPIRLSDVCTWVDIMHEVMHALGFVHEQSRTDRDQFVAVLWDNIKDPFKNQFAMVPEQLMTAQKNTPFDFQSVMMYPPDAFAQNPNEPTLQAFGGQVIAPARSGLSTQDIERLNRMYGVPDSGQ